MKHNYYEPPNIFVKKQLSDKLIAISDFGD